MCVRIFFHYLMSPWWFDELVFLFFTWLIAVKCTMDHVLVQNYAKIIMFSRCWCTFPRLFSKSKILIQYYTYHGSSLFESTKGSVGPSPSSVLPHFKPEDGLGLTCNFNPFRHLKWKKNINLSNNRNIYYSIWT